jgi:hypothetical protein
MQLTMTANADYRRRRFPDNDAHARLIARAPRNAGSRRMLTPTAVILSLTVA